MLDKLARNFFDAHVNASFKTFAAEVDPEVRDPLQAKTSESLTEQAKRLAAEKFQNNSDNQ